MTEQKRKTARRSETMIGAQNIEELFIEENLMFLLTLKIDQIWIKGLHIKEKKTEDVEREDIKNCFYFDIIKISILLSSTRKLHYNNNRRKKLIFTAIIIL